MSKVQVATDNNNESTNKPTNIYMNDSILHILNYRMSLLKKKGKHNSKTYGRQASENEPAHPATVIHHVRVFFINCCMVWIQSAAGSCGTCAAAHPENW